MNSITEEYQALPEEVSPPFSLAVFTLAPELSFEYDLSLAFAKNTSALQSRRNVEETTSVIYSVHGPIKCLNDRFPSTCAILTLLYA